MAEKVGEIYYDIGADVADLLQATKQANSSLDDMGRGADRASGSMKRFDSASQSAGKAVVRAANDSSQAAKTMEALGNEVAILEERQKNGARSALMLAAELRAGSGATAAQRKEISALAGQLYDLKNAQDQASAAQQKTTTTSGALRTGLSAIASAIAISQVIEYGKQFLEVADSMTQLQARIDRLSPSAKEGAATFQALASIASASGSSLKDTEKLWETLTSSLQNAGATNGQILALTDTLQKIGRIGGSSSEEMANALRQFGQSIAGGTVRAEEFNSIIEQMPELARQMAAGLGVSVGDLRKRMLEGKLSAEDALNAIMSQTGKVNSEFSRLPRTVDQATNSLSISFQEFIKQINDATGASTGMVHIIDSISSAIDSLAGKVPNATQQIAELNSTADMFARRARTYSFLGLDGWAAQAEGINAVSNRAAALVGDLAAITKANNAAANAPPIKITSAGGDSKEVQKLEKSTKRKLELSKLEGEARARLQAQYDAEDAGITDSKRVKALQDEYAATERNTSSRKENNAEGKKSAAQAESVAQKLANLKQQSELAGESTKALSREQAILTAQQSLGKGATQDDIRLAGEYAAKKWDVANAVKAQSAAEKLLPETRENSSYKQDLADLNTALSAKKITQQQYNATAEKLEQDHQAKLAQIRSEQAVAPQQQSAGMVDPVQALANENAQKLALIQQFEQQKTLTEQQGLALRNAANTEYEQQRIAAQWEIWRNQSAGNEALAASFDSIAGNASNAFTGMITGSMSAQEAMSSLASNALNSLVNAFVQMGVEWVKSAIMGQTAQTAAIGTVTAVQTAATATQTATSVAAAGTTAAAWTPAAILSSIASMGTAAAIGLGAVVGILGSSILGKRKNGGPVTAGGMYQVGESGLPEIYQASTGKQYMIPGDNGKVISNKDIQGAGGSGVILNINNYSSASVDAQATQGSDGTWTIDAFIADMNSGGPASQAITSNMNVKRTPRGQG